MPKSLTKGEKIGSDSRGRSGSGLRSKTNILSVESSMSLLLLPLLHQGARLPFDDIDPITRFVAFSRQSASSILNAFKTRRVYS